LTSVGFDEGKFEGFIQNLCLANSWHKDLLVGRNLKLNTPPPERLWHNIVPTIIVIDALREHYGAPIKIISCYRSEAYNDPVASGNSGRAQFSTHQAFSACDFKVDGIKPHDVKALLQGWECSKWFWSAISFNRVTETLSANNGNHKIKMGPMPKVHDAGGLPGVEFQFRGYIKSYGTSFTHLDTRGMTPSTPGDLHKGEGDGDEGNT
jgi:hypothetical protein